MIVAREVDEYRECDVSTCECKARWEFTVEGEGQRPYRVYVCGEHHVEGFARARELL